MSVTTTDTFAAAKAKYLDQIDGVLARLNGAADHPAQALRQHALKSLESGSFPGRKDEDWKYTSVRGILAEEYREAPKNPSVATTDFSDLDAYNLLFINGVYIPGESDTLGDRVFFGTLEEAWNNASIRDTLVAQIQKITAQPLPVFDALNAGLATETYYLSVAEGVQIDKPIRIVQFMTTDHTIQVHPSLITSIGKHGRAEVVEAIFNVEEPPGSHFNLSHRIFADAGAHLNVYRRQSAARATRLIAHTTVYQQSDSTVGVYSLELGAELMRHNLHVIHEGTNITSNLYGVFIARQGQHTDTQSFIDHALPHCQSNELYKGILSGNGRGVFNGKIIVRQDAQKTNAFQQNSTLVLSPNAVMDSKPQLEIFADDVKCSHGATIGQLDENAVFYLRSRGLTPARARLLLQKAFIQEVLDNFPNQSIAGLFGGYVDSVMDEIVDN